MTALPQGRRSIPGPVALAVGALLAVFLSQGAAAHGPDPLLGGGLYPRDAVLKWTWMAGQAPPAWMQASIEAGAADSNASRASRAPTFTRAAGGPGDVQYGLNVPCGVGGLACARRLPPNDFLIAFREQGHPFDWGTLNWCQFSPPGPNGCYDVENVTLDELGHVLVLDHHLNYADQRDYLDAVVQSISRTKPAAGWNAHVFGPCDKATLQREYGLQLASSNVSLCLSIPTTLGLSASKTSVAYGASVTFTATLAAATSTTYGRLSGQPLSGRTVTIERRLPGSTAWTSLGTMTAGATSGTYTFTLNQTYTYDWRAVFTKPASEGLLGNTSASVRVTVGACTKPPCPVVLTGRGPDSDAIGSR